MTKLFRDTDIGGSLSGGPDPIPEDVRKKIEEIQNLRNQLPDNWKWTKCYELSYIDTYSGKSFIKKHWALTGLDGKGPVHSLGLISQDSDSDRKQFFREAPVQFVEQSLSIIDTLLPTIQAQEERIRVLEEANKGLTSALAEAIQMSTDLVKTIKES